MTNDSEHSNSELYYLDKLEFQENTEGTVLNYQRAGAMNQLFFFFFHLRPYKKTTFRIFRGKSQTLLNFPC